MFFFRRNPARKRTMILVYYAIYGYLKFMKPFLWSWGTAQPIVNEQSWTNLSSVLWVEQPVGTGFSQGTPNITSNTAQPLSDVEDEEDGDKDATSTKKKQRMPKQFRKVRGKLGLLERLAKDVPLDVIFEVRSAS